MWVRGLKHYPDDRTRGPTAVAPHVGAWIETSIFLSSIIINQSHPMWVRGLKHRRVPIVRIIRRVAPHVGAWIETPLPRSKNG